jgi:hypothetical protein
MAAIRKDEFKRLTYILYLCVEDKSEVCPKNKEQFMLAIHIKCWRSEKYPSTFPGCLTYSLCCSSKIYKARTIQQSVNTTISQMSDVRCPSTDRLTRYSEDVQSMFRNKFIKGRQVCPKARSNYSFCRVSDPQFSLCPSTPVFDLRPASKINIRYGPEPEQFKNERSTKASTRHSGIFSNVRPNRGVWLTSCQHKWVQVRTIQQFVGDIFRRCPSTRFDLLAAFIH